MNISCHVCPDRLTALDFSFLFSDKCKFSHLHDFSLFWLKRGPQVNQIKIKIGQHGISWDAHLHSRPQQIPPRACGKPRHPTPFFYPMHSKMPVVIMHGYRQVPPKLIRLSRTVKCWIIAWLILGPSNNSLTITIMRDLASQDPISLQLCSEFLFI